MILSSEPVLTFNLAPLSFSATLHNTDGSRNQQIIHHKSSRWTSKSNRGAVEKQIKQTQNSNR